MECGELRRRRQLGANILGFVSSARCLNIFWAWVLNPIVGHWAPLLQSPLFHNRTRGWTWLSCLLIECEMSRSRTFLRDKI
jgi:hypothetical protein